MVSVVAATYCGYFFNFKYNRHIAAMKSKLKQRIDRIATHIRRRLIAYRWLNGHYGKCYLFVPSEFCLKSDCRYLSSHTGKYNRRKWIVELILLRHEDTPLCESCPMRGRREPPQMPPVQSPKSEERYISPSLILYLFL